MKVKLVFPDGSQAETEFETLEDLKEVSYGGKVYGVKVVMRPTAGSHFVLPTIVLKNKRREIAFKFGGKHYTVAYEACEKNMIVLPDRCTITADFWIMSEDSPRPVSLHEQEHGFRFLPAKAIAKFFGLPLAIEVETHCRDEAESEDTNKSTSEPEESVFVENWGTFTRTSNGWYGNGGFYDPTTPMARKCEVESRKIKGDKVYETEAMQRQHDYYVYMHAQGYPLADWDKEQYELVMQREHDGKVKSWSLSAENK